MSRAIILGAATALLTTSALAGSDIPIPRPSPFARAAAYEQVATTAVAPEAVPIPVSAPEPHEATATAQAAVAAAFDTELAAAPQAAAGPLNVSSDELGALASAIGDLKRGDLNGALAQRANLRDPGSLALLDWLAIRFASRQIGFARLEWFVRSRPNWPAIKQVRQRAEEALWNENIEPIRVRTFFGSTRPVTEEGKLALARALIIGGESTAGAAWVRDAFRNDVTNPPFEAEIEKRYGAVLTQADYKQRAELLFFNERVDQALKVAADGGSAYFALAKARAAVIRKAKNAGELLEAVPREARREPGYYFALAQYLRRQERFKEAATVLLQAPKDAGVLGDPDEWWTERRLLARELLEVGDAKTAYIICRDHAARSREARAEAEFHAGWIALRFLKDPGTAAKHFGVVLQMGTTAITAARANYWLGRAAEAAGDTTRAKAYYSAAARLPTVYYGQLARNRLGSRELPLRELPKVSAEGRTLFERNEATRALRLLYRLKEKDLALSLAVAYADSLEDPEQLSLLAQLVGQQMDVRTMLAVGKSAVSRGYPLDALAYPTIGIPNFNAVGRSVEKPLVYAIARQESGFNPGAVSRVGARGLLQLMPATAQRTARAVGLPFDARRLTSDPAYNAQLGAAHLRELTDLYNGSYILTFAAYNAGPGRVREWLQRYGDPRTGQIDPVDWVELIPFTETRNYVMRVMENVQVYRARMAGRSALTIEADLRRGGPSAQ